VGGDEISAIMDVLELKLGRLSRIYAIHQRNCILLPQYTGFCVGGDQLKDKRPGQVKEGTRIQFSSFSFGHLRFVRYRATL
jgi:hypothetical protein